MSSIKRIIYPLIKLLIQKGVSCRVFEDMIRNAYVEVASKEFDLDKKKQTNSRIAVLTGLSRKEVLRLKKLEEAKGDAEPSEEQDFYNRAARVLTAWLREPKYCNAKGEPATLHIESGERSFRNLVKEYSGDMTYRSILDELLRVGAVKLLNARRVKLISNGYTPSNSEKQILNILGEDSSMLIQTIIYNLENIGKHSHFQKKVFYDSIPKDVLPKLKKIVRDRSQSTLEEIDRFLSVHDAGDNEDKEKLDLTKAGLGIYYIEE